MKHWGIFYLAETWKHRSNVLSERTLDFSLGWTLDTMYLQQIKYFIALTCQSHLSYWFHAIISGCLHFKESESHPYLPPVRSQKQDLETEARGLGVPPKKKLNFIDFPAFCFFFVLLKNVFPRNLKFVFFFLVRSNCVFILTTISNSNNAYKSHINVPKQGVPSRNDDPDSTV